MSVLLAIDTSIGTSVALQVGTGTGQTGTSESNTGEHHSSDERGHTEVIGGLMARLFAEMKVSPRDIDGVVVGIGPGPFTGLRVGIAAAKAFATGLGVPLYPISGHEAVAYEEMPDTPDAPPVRVLQDARRRELFVTEYSGLDAQGLPLLASGPKLLARADYVEEARDVWPQHIPASTLLWLAELRLRAGVDFGLDQALYLRAPDVKPAGAIKRVSA